MQYISIFLRNTIIITLLPCIMYGGAASENTDLVEQTIEAIRDCMNGSPASWPDEWKKEYIQTILSAISSHQDVPHYDERLEILHKGFRPYWESFTKSNERSLFEIHRARIRWYVEYLMSTEFPTEEERQKLRDQYTDIWEYAAHSLLKQFPFLDPKAVQKAKQNDLNECYHKIEMPLMPVYLKPISEEQVEQIKQRWDKLRYIRVDLWRRLSDGFKMGNLRGAVHFCDRKHKVCFWEI
jgi:hypothetical protein